MENKEPEDSLWGDLDKFAKQAEEDKKNESEPVHLWFSLSYSSYLVIPRAFLQSMPQPWQRKFIDLLEEMEEIIDAPDKIDSYWVRATNGKKLIHDPYGNYDRGRRIVPLKKKEP